MQNECILLLTVAAVKLIFPLILNLFRERLIELPRTEKLMKNYLIMSLLIVSILLFFTGCTIRGLQKNVENKPVLEPLQIGKLISQVYSAVQRQAENEDLHSSEIPLYLDRLLADRRLVIGLGVGTTDLAEIVVPSEVSGCVSMAEYVIQGKKILVEGRLILNENDFQKALTECEIIFVSTHARFGAGPAFFYDGKANPYRMQRTKGYVVSMSEAEVDGYQGSVIRTYDGFLKQKKYFDFKPDSRDLDKAVPFPGYQMIVMSTCSSEKHFLDDIAWLRAKYPTTAIFTTKPCGVDPLFRTFKRMLYGVFKGDEIHRVVEEMNEEYISVAWEYMQKRIPPWSVIDGMYKIGIHNIN